METQTSEGAVINCGCAIAKGQADRAEPLRPVHVRVWTKDKDCDEKRSATRSCNGSAFSIHSWAHWCVRRDGSKQIQTSPWYGGYLPGASRRGGSRMPRIPRKDFDRARSHHWYAARSGKEAFYAAARIDGPDVRMHKYLCPGWARVNHQNGNGLDNRRENLRGAGRTDSSC